MRREITLDESINEPNRKLKLLKTNKIFHTAKPTFLSKVEGFINKTIPSRINYINEKKEINYLTKYLKDYNFEKELTEFPPLYFYTSILLKGNNHSTNNTSSTYQSINKSINRSQVSYYYLNQKNKKFSRLKNKSIKAKLLKKEKFHQPGFIPDKVYDIEDKNKKRNVITEEIPIEKYLKRDFYPLKKALNETYGNEKQKLKKDINQDLSIPKSIISQNDFSIRNQFISKYVTLFPKEEKDYCPRNQLYNIERIKKNYGIDDKYMKKINYEKPKIEIPKDKLKHIIKKGIISSSKQFVKLNIEYLPPEYYVENIRPYINKDSELYFIEIKNDNIDQFIDLTFKNKLLLLDIDYSHETILHIMAKRNINLYISFALRNGANPNHKNYIGRTPLHLACEYNQIESILVLLFEMANPYIKDIYGKTPFDLWEKKEETAKDYILRTQTIKRYNLLNMLYQYSYKNYSDYIRNGLLYLWNVDLDINFNPDKYGILIKSKKK